MAPDAPNVEDILTDDMTDEERRNLIRFGPVTTGQREQTVAINLLRKYRPIINLNNYKQMAANLDIEAEEHAKLMRKQRITTEIYDNHIMGKKKEIRSNSRELKN